MKLLLVFLLWGLLLVPACTPGSSGLNGNNHYLESIASVFAGNGTSFVIDNNRSLWGWGSNRAFEINRNYFINNPILEKEPVHLLSNVIHMSTSGMLGRIGGYVLAIRDDNTLWGWGLVPFPGLSPSSPLLVVDLPTQILDDVAYVAAGFSHVVAIDTGGVLWTWGMSFFGYFDVDVDLDIDLTPVIDNVYKVSAGLNTTFAIKNDNTLWAWGSNNGHGQVGSGNTEVVSEPIMVLNDVVNVSAGFDFTMAVKSDNTLWAWGNNEFGQLGVQGTGSLYPIMVKENIKYASAGFGYTMAIDIDGTLWAWGSNILGQLGDGSNENSEVPVAIMDNVVSVSVGGFRGNEYTLALKNDGTFWAWGANTFAQHGDATTEYRNEPHQVFIASLHN